MSTVKVFLIVFVFYVRLSVHNINFCTCTSCLLRVDLFLTSILLCVDFVLEVFINVLQNCTSTIDHIPLQLQHFSGVFATLSQVNMRWFLKHLKQFAEVLGISKTLTAFELGINFGFYKWFNLKDSIYNRCDGCHRSETTNLLIDSLVYHLSLFVA